MCMMADNSCREEKLGCKNCYYNNEGMIIKTKFKLGERVWIVKKNIKFKIVEVFSDVIESVNIDECDGVQYSFKGFCDYCTEKNIIKYEDSVSLLNYIKTIDDTLNKED